MIRIIHGTYGYIDENGIVKPKTAADAPFELKDKGREAELVELGVAVYADNQHYSMDMKTNELRAIAKEMGLTFKVGTTKAEMVAAMDTLQAESIEEEPDDDLPELDLDEVVQ